MLPSCVAMPLRKTVCKGAEFAQNHRVARSAIQRFIRQIDQIAGMETGSKTA